MISTQAVTSSFPTRTPASDVLSISQPQTELKGSLDTFHIQPKLSIGAPDDPLEKEADEMADKVMRVKMPDPINFLTTSSKVNRKCAHCEEEEKKLHRKENNNSSISFAPTIVHDVLSSAGGRSLDTDTRSFMESRFKFDFGNVKIHDNDLAAQSATSINALAYTSGNNIVFNHGQFSPHTESGRRLLAHELTHTIQQGGSNESINRFTDEEEIGILSRKAMPGQIQRQEENLTRPQEISRSNTTPGEASVSLQPLSISIYNFAINGHHLKSEHRQLLNEVISLLSHPNAQNWRIEVTGHADSSGEPVVNDPLSVRRANEVRRFLRRQLGARITSHGEGEDTPFVSNETISGRSRNRRVDIVFVSERSILRPSEETDSEETGTDDDTIRQRRERERRRPPRRTETEEDNRTFCARHPIICGLGGGGILIPIILCGIFWEVCLCAMVPSLCTIPPPPPPPPPDDDPEKERPPAHACVADVTLPSGDLPMFAEWPYLGLQDAFWMFIAFRQSPDEGCECHCGEYRQDVRGFFEKEFQNGTIERRPKPLTPGVTLDETNFNEDGNGSANSEYGHRSHPRRAIDDDRQVSFDAFFDTQANGCYYLGNDNPGFGSPIAEHDEVRRTIFLEFRGGPVDTCVIPGVRTPLMQHWNTWRVRGEIRKPPPVTPRNTTPQNGPRGSGGSTNVVNVTPRPTRHSATTSYPSWYAGGISPTAGVNDAADMQLAFRVDGRSEIFVVTIHIIVVEANADSITIQTTNNVSLNVAPEGVPDVILAPRKRVTISRNVLRRF